MRLEIFGLLFAAFSSLFVTVENNPLTKLFPTDLSPFAPFYGVYLKGKEQQNLPLRLRGVRGVTENPPSINAHSAWVGCLCDEPPLFAKYSSAQLPLASITKIMTSYMALRELGPDYLVTISDEAIATEGIAGGLQAGERLAIKDLITMAMTYSSNDVAMALAEALGKTHGAENFAAAIAFAVRLMNDEAHTLGMRHTFFQNPTGLDFAHGPSNFSTAEDWAILLEATRVQPLLWDLARDPVPRVVSAGGIAHELINLNPFRSFPHYVGGKTGTTDFAGENLVMLFERPLGKLEALILFGAPVGAREAEAKKLLDWIASF